jgi:hypothetical protein
LLKRAGEAARMAAALRKARGMNVSRISARIPMLKDSVYLLFWPEGIAREFFI